VLGPALGVEVEEVGERPGQSLGGRGPLQGVAGLALEPAAATDVVLPARRPPQEHLEALTGGERLIAAEVTPATLEAEALPPPLAQRRERRIVLAPVGEVEQIPLGGPGAQLPAEDPRDLGLPPPWGEHGQVVAADVGLPQEGQAPDAAAQ